MWQQRDRILLVVVGDHLDDSERMLIELTNLTAKTDVDVTTEQQRAEELLVSNRLYRRTALDRGEDRVATLLGGKAWETAGRIWYRALASELGPRSRFQHCADATWRAAGELFGAGSAPQEAVLAGWKSVGIDVSQAVIERGPRLRVREAQEHFEPPAAAAEVPHFLS